MVQAALSSVDRDFRIYIGIDQTGATDAKGSPKPLPVAMIFKPQRTRGAMWRLEFAENRKRLEIKGLYRDEVLELCQRFSLLGRDLSRTAIVVDSVLGLPQKAYRLACKKWGLANGDMHSLFSQAYQFEFKGKTLGLKTAGQFFSQFLAAEPGASPLVPSKRRSPPTRICEGLAQANSVFQMHPFQKNIGCGSFRIWKELGSADKWYLLAPFDPWLPHLQDQPWIFEGYPSLIWKKMIHPNRKGFELKKFIMELKNEGILDFAVESISSLDDPDLQDSVVLAIGAWALDNIQGGLLSRGLQNLPRAAKQSEGWILGVEPLRPRVQRGNHFPWKIGNPLPQPLGRETLPNLDPD
jgi:hypothetical protein